MRSAMVGTGERAVIVEQQHKRRLIHASVFNSLADLIRLDSSIEAASCSGPILLHEAEEGTPFHFSFSLAAKHLKALEL